MGSADLLAACDRGDEVRLEQLGWRPVLDALRFWPKRLAGADLAPYCSLLGDEDPDVIVTALRGFAEETPWRPSPVEVYLRIHPPAPEKPAEEVYAGRTRKPRADQTPVAYAAVRAAVAFGEDLCECRPRPTTMTIDRDGVLRCPDCQGLEPGQHDQAMEEEAQ